jgi:SAM-dependent methyltransferase
MVMEHVPDEQRYLDEIRRMLRPGGRAYITTVFKRRWAWYFRKRGGESVLDTSHLREYTDLPAFEALVLANRRFSELLAIELVPLWFPLLDPVLFRLGSRLTARTLAYLRRARVPIPGYFSLEIVVAR